RLTSQSGMDVAITRISLAPSSVSCCTRCEPRKPVPPVMSVTARWRFSMAARRLVPVGVMRAVRFPGVLEGIKINSHAAAPRRSAFIVPGRRCVRVLYSNLLSHELLLALALPQPPQCLRVERLARAVAQVHHFMAHAGCDQAISLGAWHALRHRFQ